MLDPRTIIKLVADYFFSGDQTKKEMAVKIATAAVTVLVAAAGALQVFIDAVK